MAPLVEQLEDFLTRFSIRPAADTQTVKSALQALRKGSGNLVVAFELELLAQRLRPGTEDHKLLSEVSAELKRAAFASECAGYRPRR